MFKFKMSPEKAEYIEAMFRMGMTIGEVQTIYNQVSTNTLKSFKKSLQIDPESIKGINTNAIEKLIKKGIQERIITETEKVDILINHLKQREIEQKQKQEKEKQKKQKPKNANAKEPPKPMRERIKVEKPIQKVAQNDDHAQNNSQQVSEHKLSDIQNER